MNPAAARRVWAIDFGRHNVRVNAIAPGDYTEAMGAPVLVSEQEYLSTAYEPDCDWVDGRLEERNSGEREHSILEREFTYFFRAHRDEWAVDVFPEQRLRLSGGRYRVPDVCVYRRPAPREKVFSSPPWIVIEVLSLEDQMSRVRTRISEFLDFGVTYVWAVDPESRTADVYTRGGMQPASSLVLATSDPRIEVPLGGIFSALDD